MSTESRCSPAAAPRAWGSVCSAHLRAHREARRPAGVWQKANCCPAGKGKKCCCGSAVLRYFLWQCWVSPSLPCPRVWGRRAATGILAAMSSSAHASTSIYLNWLIIAELFRSLSQKAFGSCVGKISEKTTNLNCKALINSSALSTKAPWRNH